MRRLSTYAGFTILELAVTTSVFAILIGIGLPVTLSFVRSYSLKAERDSLVTVLEWARDQSLANASQSAHGVRINSNQYVGYVGSSYASRNQPFDVPFGRSSAITVTGPTDFVFSPLTGATTAGTITLNNGTRQANISLNQEGSLDW